MTVESQFIDAYIDALLWSSTVFHPTDDPDVGSMADDFEPHDSFLLAQSEEECLHFLEDSYALIIKAIAADDSYSFEAAGHDFALTRNGHGAGFWDRGLGELGDILTERAESFGSVVLYLDDNEYVCIA